jgi:hypothetical protein
VKTFVFTKCFPWWSLLLVWLQGPSWCWQRAVTHYHPSESPAHLHLPTEPPGLTLSTNSSSFPGLTCEHPWFLLPLSTISPIQPFPGERAVTSSTAHHPPATAVIQATSLPQLHPNGSSLQSILDQPRRGFLPLDPVTAWLDTIVSWIVLTLSWISPHDQALFLLRVTLPDSGTPHFVHLTDLIPKCAFYFLLWTFERCSLGLEFSYPQGLVPIDSSLTLVVWFLLTDLGWDATSSKIPDLFPVCSLVTLSLPLSWSPSKL